MCPVQNNILHNVLQLNFFKLEYKTDMNLSKDHIFNYRSNLYLILA